MGGVGLPWNLALAAAIGLWLLFTRLTLGVDGNLAHAHHVIRALVLTVVSVAAAEVARPVRFLNVALGAALMAAPFLIGADRLSTIATIVMGPRWCCSPSTAVRSASATAAGTA